MPYETDGMHYATSNGIKRFGFSHVITDGKKASRPASALGPQVPVKHSEQGLRGLKGAINLTHRSTKELIYSSLETGKIFPVYDSTYDDFKDNIVSQN